MAEQMCIPSAFINSQYPNGYSCSLKSVVTYKQPADGAALFSLFTLLCCS